MWLDFDANSFDLNLSLSYLDMYMEVELPSQDIDLLKCKKWHNPSTWEA